MRQLSREENRIKLKAEVPEDLWHLEKIIKPGDLVSGSSFRKFVSDSGNAERKSVFIIVRVEKAEFHKGFGKLRVLGTIIGGSPEEFVQVGAHHSLDFDVDDVISIQKYQWHHYELERIKEAQESAKRVKVHALILDEREAELFVIREFGVDALGKVSVHGRGKYADEGKDLKNKFFGEMLELIKSSSVEKLIIAGPGFEKENFMKFLKDKEASLARSTVVEAIGNTGRQGVFELINKDVVSSVSESIRFNDEVKAVEELVSKVSTDYVTYGLKEVEEAVDFGAVDKLLVIDSFLFENKDVQRIIEKAEKMRSKVMIISHENEISDKLKGLTGIAAILRFKIS